jgi:hypothetical protein
MVALGVGTLWLGYTVGLWGYCLIRGYDVPFTAMFHSTWPGVQVGVTQDTPGQVLRPGSRKLGTITGHATTTNPGQVGP